MRKLNKTEAELKKSVAYKKSVYFVGASNDPPLEVGVKAYLIYFFCSVVNLKLFLRES